MYQLVYIISSINDTRNHFSKFARLRQPYAPHDMHINRYIILKLQTKCAEVNMSHFEISNHFILTFGFGLGVSLFLSLDMHVLLITPIFPGASQYSHGFSALDVLLTLYSTIYMLLSLYIANTSFYNSYRYSVHFNCVFLLFADLHLKTHSHSKTKN